MEKRLRSSLQTSAEEFLVSATKLGFPSGKLSLKTLLHSLTSSNTIISTLPISLHQSISQSITKFKQLSDESSAADVTASPRSPPTKRHRRSARISKNDDDSGTNNDKREDAKKCVVKNIQIYAYVALMCVSHPKKAFSASDLLPSAHELHDNLILFEFDSVLMLEVSNLCEEWWKGSFPGRETLISQSLPVLLSRSLTLKKKVDVHKVYAIREAFLLFDFEDESIEDLKLLLIRCLIAPLYLKTDDGKKFLAFMFGLSGQLVKEALAMIRSQIPFRRKSMLEAYSEIIFRAWKVGNEGSRDEIENGFLQGLIESAIHASSTPFAASIRRVLGGFITQRTSDGVEKLLFRLAEPVIFRSLQVANSNVRLNALHLLLDLFPLEDPDATKEGKDMLLEKQFFLLEKLLTDACPDIRVVAVEGSCRLLHLFWEVITSSTITKFLTKVFDDMTHDTSHEVRLSTVNGIIYLLGNPQSHEILKVLLPRFGYLISDSALSVRAAAVDLLLLIRDIRNFQFHKVVGLDVLLSTLASDQPVVAQKITKLLIPSYFPSGLTSEDACRRCVTLIKRSPQAGARFCEFALSEGASLQSLMELFKIFMDLTLSHDNLDVDQMDALLVASAYLCDNLVSQESYKASLRQQLSGEKLKRLLIASSTGHAQSSICNIVSKISPDGMDTFIEECMGLVTNCSGLFDNLDMQAGVRSAHKMMLSCDWFTYMFETLARLLQVTANGCHLKYGVETPKHDFPSTKLRKNKSSIKISKNLKHTSRKKASNHATSRFQEDYAIAAGICWQIKDLLISEDTRKAMLESGVLEIAFSSLKVISEVSIVQSKQCDYMNTSPVLAYTALALHISFNADTINGITNQGTKAKEFSGRPASEQTLLDKTMDHLLSCTSKLFGVADSGKSSKESTHSNIIGTRSKKHRKPQNDVSMPHDDGSRLSNIVKMLSAVLKFIVDASTMDLVPHNQPRSLKFTLEYLEFITSNLSQHSWDKMQFNEDDMKETFLCLKSSFTYVAKLLNLVLTSPSETSPPLPEVYILSNKLLDLIISIEQHMGSVYAARIISAAKPWLPDFVLGLGSWNILKQSPRKSSPDHIKFSFPSWLTILAKVEVSEIALEGAEDDMVNLGEFPAFRKLVGLMIQLLRANHQALDAVGVILLTGLVVGLENKDFGLVLGLVHFVCTKLVRNNGREWGELKMMLEFVQEIYPLIEREAEELSNGEEGQQKLQSARELLQPIWIVFETGREQMEEE